MGFKKLLFTALIPLTATIGYAQTDVDALRYSQSSITGTARFTSMAGAFGALGGDFSSINVNPAGLGIYRKSEFSFSTSFFVNNTTTDFIGRTYDENKFNFNIPNLGFVFTHLTEADRKNKEGWKNVSVGMGINRVQNFHTNSFYESVNRSNSLLNHFVETANNGNSLDPFYEQLAYDAGIIYNDTDGTTYISDVGEAGTYPISQQRSSVTRGGIYEWNISVGANYNNKIYLGGGFGISSLRYIEESTYSEYDRADVIPVLNSYSMHQDIITRGTGFNFKFGIIARPVDWVRLGASFHTPTIYPYMQDEYRNTMVSSLDNIPTSPVTSPDGVYNYGLITPLKAVGSIAFIIGKTGLISADYEFINYSGARFDSPGASFSEVNNTIRSKYTPTGNFRIGGEYRYDVFNFRAGYGFYGSPINSIQRISGGDYSKNYYSGGLGIRHQNYFIEMAYSYTKSNEYFQQYTLENNAPVEGSSNKVISHNFVMTLGAKF